MVVIVGVDKIAYIVLSNPMTFKSSGIFMPNSQAALIIAWAWASETAKCRPVVFLFEKKFCGGKYTFIRKISNHRHFQVFLLGRLPLALFYTPGNGFGQTGMAGAEKNLIFLPVSPGEPGNSLPGNRVIVHVDIGNIFTYRVIVAALDKGIDGRQFVQNVF